MAATAELNGQNLSLWLDKSSTKIARVIMPKGLKIPAEVSRKLGASSSIVMSGGSTMLQPGSKSLGNFEIQD